MVISEFVKLVTVSLNVAVKFIGDSNIASTNTANEVTYDTKLPDVEISLADGQTNPTYNLPLKFKVKFSEKVVDFSEQSISYGGSSDITIDITGGDLEYTIAMNDVLANETITIYIAEGIVHDAAGNANTTAVNTDNSITYLGTTSIGNISSQSGVKVYYSFGKIVISFNEVPQEKVSVEVYNINGQHILKKNLSDKLNYLTVKPSSYYFLRLSGKDLNHFAKIFAQ